MAQFIKDCLRNGLLLKSERYKPDTYFFNKPIKTPKDKVWEKTNFKTLSAKSLLPDLHQKKLPIQLCMKANGWQTQITTNLNAY